jgi:hypothetical protein
MIYIAETMNRMCYKLLCVLCHFSIPVYYHCQSCRSCWRHGAAAGVASHYGFGSDQMMRLWLRNTDLMEPELQCDVALAPMAPPPNMII